jgi:hypothetical protein
MWSLCVIPLLMHFELLFTANLDLEEENNGHTLCAWASAAHVLRTWILKSLFVSTVYCQLIATKSKIQNHSYSDFLLKSPDSHRPSIAVTGLSLIECIYLV